MTDAVPQHQGHAPDTTRLLTIAGGEPLKFPGSNMRLTFEHRYRVIETKDDADRGRWKATTVAYLYDIDDEVGELLAYHWHPVGHHADPRPHLHIRTDEGGRIWLPAGRVAVEEIIRLLVEQFEVAPQRNDWEQILDEAQTAFETWRTWGMTPPPTAQSR